MAMVGFVRQNGHRNWTKWALPGSGEDVEDLVDALYNACAHAGGNRQLPPPAPVVSAHRVAELLCAYGEELEKEGPGRGWERRALKSLKKRMEIPKAGIGGGAEVPIGTKFRYRCELVALGLHPEPVCGIGMASPPGILWLKLAAAICADLKNQADYLDHVSENGIVYKGQGQGKDMYSDENMSLLRTMVWHATEVRVFRLAGGTLRAIGESWAGEAGARSPPVRVFFGAKVAAKDGKRIESLGEYCVTEMRFDRKPDARPNEGVVTCFLERRQG